MGERLFPATQQKNVIATLIENGTITGDLADRWMQKSNKKDATEILLNEAKKGGAQAMELIGFHYKYGTNEFLKKDLPKACEWLQKAHEKGSSVYATEQFGHLLLTGSDGVPQDHTKGIMLLSVAAGKGSDWAASMLGHVLATGMHGITVDEAEARRFFEMALDDSCAHKTMDPGARAKAQAKLDELNSA